MPAAVDTEMGVTELADRNLIGSTARRGAALRHSSRAVGDNTVATPSAHASNSAETAENALRVTLLAELPAHFVSAELGLGVAFLKQCFR